MFISTVTELRIPKRMTGILPETESELKARVRIRPMGLNRNFSSKSFTNIINNCYKLYTSLFQVLKDFVKFFFLKLWCIDSFFLQSCTITAAVECCRANSTPDYEPTKNGLCYATLILKTEVCGGGGSRTPEIILIYY